jgi:hypothetical protein
MLALFENDNALARNKAPPHARKARSRKQNVFRAIWSLSGMIKNNT